jgi:hypothetical protein
VRKEDSFPEQFRVFALRPFRAWHWVYAGYPAFYRAAAKAWPEAQRSVVSALLCAGVLSAAPRRAAWSGAGYFSLWYPAAGLRLAVLWRRGARFAIWLMLAEIAENWCSDNFSPHGAALIADVVSVARPCIGYGLAVALVRRATEHGQGLLATAPMPLGLTAIVGPVLDALLIIPAGAIMAPGVAMSSIRIDLTVSISGMAVGDLLGIMVITPPLLWLMGGAKWAGACARRCAGPMDDRWGARWGGWCRTLC